VSGGGAQMPSSRPAQEQFRDVIRLRGGSSENDDDDENTLLNSLVCDNSFLVSDFDRLVRRMRLVVCGEVVVCEMIKEASCVSRICIPRCIEVIGSFSGGPDEGCPIASSMKTVRFESNSKVRRIRASFRFSSLDSIFIPRSVAFGRPLFFGGQRL
jgi:hypothetical protein